MYLALDGLFHVQIADAAKTIAKSQRVLAAQPSAARACSSSASSTCLGRRSFSCFMGTSLSLSLLIVLKEARPPLRRPAIEHIKYFKRKSKGKTRITQNVNPGLLNRTLKMYNHANPIEHRIKNSPLLTSKPEKYLEVCDEV